MAHVLNWQNHWTDDWSRSLENAVQNISLALQKSPQVAFVRCIAAVFFLCKKDLDRSAAEADAGVNLNPNYAPLVRSKDLRNDVQREFNFEAYELLLRGREQALALTRGEEVGRRVTPPSRTATLS